jgi:hypothetical protein
MDHHISWGIHSAPLPSQVPFGRIDPRRTPEETQPTKWKRWYAPLSFLSPINKEGHFLFSLA